MRWVSYSWRKISVDQRKKLIKTVSSNSHLKKKIFLLITETTVKCVLQFIQSSGEKLSVGHNFFLKKKKSARKEKGKCVKFQLIRNLQFLS
jgi:hypothetical protein